MTDHEILPHVSLTHQSQRKPNNLPAHPYEPSTASCHQQGPDSPRQVTTPLSHRRRTILGVHFGRNDTDRILTDPPQYNQNEPYNTKIAAWYSRIRRRRHNAGADSATVGVITKKQQKWLLKQERKRQRKELEDLAAYQREQFRDTISRQLEVHELARKQAGAPDTKKRSFRKTIKKLVKKTESSPDFHAAAPLPSNRSVCQRQRQPAPRLEDFNSKDELHAYFNPDAFDNAATTLVERPNDVAELPDTTVSGTACPQNSRDYSKDMAKSDFIATQDFDPPPPVSRSPSPFSVTLPRRGITISEVSAPNLNKQMQCDCCHDPIKMTSFFYACYVCDEGDRIYCTKCTNDGSTCRHELVEKTRDIKRHPTNPRLPERRSAQFDQDPIFPLTTVNGESTTLPRTRPIPQRQPTLSTEHPGTSGASGANTEPPFVQDTVSTIRSKDIEHRKREEEIALREKEMSLREREAILREREALAIQHMHTVTMLRNERAAEVGSQFPATLTRHSSRCDRQCSLHRPTSEGWGSIQLDQSVVHNLPKQSLQSVFQMVSDLNLTTAGGGATRQRGNSGGSAGPKPGRQTSGGAPAASRNNSNRRKSSKRSNGEKDRDENDEEDGSGSPKRPKCDNNASTPDAKVFACPYCKYDTERYSERNFVETHYRGCTSGLFRDISRVKQHLKRIHHMPDYYCRRCFSQFETDESLNQHMARPDACNREECPFPEKLDQTKQNKIHIKRPGKNPEDLWYEIFSIIFPGVARPASPYVEASENRPTNANTMSKFIDLLELKLNTSTDVTNQSWTHDNLARTFLREKMKETMLDLMQDLSIDSPVRSNDVPSVFVSPVSAAPQQPFSGSRQNSNSPRSSSIRQHQRQSSASSALLTPGGGMVRPALKVTTRDVSTTSIAASRASSGMQVPQYVQDDPGYGLDADSWNRGDDYHITLDDDSGYQEPASATSASSRKSVSFATPPQIRAVDRHRLVANNSWRHESLGGYGEMALDVPSPGYPFMSHCIDMSGSNLCNSNLGYSLYDKQSQPAAPDSAYGTLSTHPSQSSLHHRHNQVDCQRQTQPQQAYVDPQMLMAVSDAGQQDWMERMWAQSNGR